VVERLRVRRSEIDEAIFTRVSNRWFDQTGSGDPEYVAGLRAAGVAALDYVFVGIECSGESLQLVPAAVLAQARRAARTGVGLDTVLRRYLAGYAVLEGFVLQEAEHDEQLRQPSVLRDVLQTMSALLDRLITAVSSAYRKEVKCAGDTAPRGDERAVLERPARAPDHAGPSGGPAVPTGRVAVTGSQPTSRRDRIVEAMIEVAGERGFGKASVKLVTRRAGVSTSTFYKEFKNLQECFVVVLDLALERTGGLIVQAFAREECWRDGVLGALASLLVFFDSEPLLTRVWFVEAMAAGSWALERREHIAALLRSMIVEYWETREHSSPDPVAAAGVMASVLGLIQTHLVTEQPEQLIELLGPLMGLVTSLYLDTTEDRTREVQRGAQLAREIQARGPRCSPPVRPTPPSSVPGATLPAMLANPSARRARECLLFLAEQGLRGLSPSNREVGQGIGVTDKSQTSRLLIYLTEQGLVTKRCEGKGKRNAWRLTPRGEEIARALQG
jgi:AcrR family transcriptional regulator